MTYIEFNLSRGDFFYTEWFEVLLCESKASHFNEWFLLSVNILDLFFSLFSFLHDKLLLKLLIEYTNKKWKIWLEFLKNKVLKALQVEFNGSAQIQMTKFI